MLAIIIAWIVISFVLLSFGDMFISLYNKLCKREEKYNFIDTFILGIGFLLVLLSLTSLWLPSNHFILAGCILICIIYWVLNKNKFKAYRERTISIYKRFSPFQLVLFTCILLFVLLYVIWGEFIFDASYYHHQNIRWNEDFAVVPGLGNLEDRFGFNSNYFLVSAIFTLRFIFSEQIYGLQSILFVFILSWILVECVKSQFEIKRVILLVIFFLFYYINGYELTNSSTDIMPNLCIFYFITRFSLYPQSLNKSLLFAIAVPVCIATFKLSVFLLGLLSVYLLIVLLKEKAYKPFIYLFSFSVIFMGLWLVRNVIISGYLVYPVYEIDLFSFDWKVPDTTAKIERVIMEGHGKNVFKQFLRLPSYIGFLIESGQYKLLIYRLIGLISFICIAVSPFLVIYKTIKNRKDNAVYLILYGLSILCIIYWLISAPDFRFINGLMLATIFLVICLSIGNRTIKISPQKGNIALCVFAAGMLLLGTKRSMDYGKKLTLMQAEVSEYTFKTLFIRPYSSKDQTPKVEYTIYKMGDFDIYISHYPRRQCFDKLPSTIWGGFPFTTNFEKCQHIETVEGRGKTLQDGFRTKKEFLIPLKESFENSINIFDMD